MKNKKFFILSFLMMMTMLLAGCSTRIEQDKIKEATQIAENIKKVKEGNKQEYKLPEGYTQEVDSQKANEQIILKTSCDGDDIRLTFDISDDSVELIDIQVDYSSYIWITIVSTVILTLFFLACVCMMF